MKRLTHEEYENRVKEKQPNLKLMGEYAKYECPIQAMCLRCGHVFERYAQANLRFGCPNCSRKKEVESDNECGV